MSRQFKYFSEKLLFSKTTFRGSRFLQCFIYYHQLSIARYQVSFYANNYFEKLPIESSAFKGDLLRYGVTWHRM